MKHSALLLVLTLAAFVAGCEDPYPRTPRPDYAIRVVPGAQGPVAVPPNCADYHTDVQDPFDNQPMPQFGCASARNLALTVENPEDLIQGRTLGPSNGVTATGSMLRYTHDQTRGLMWTGDDPSKVANTTSSSPASPISGELTSGGASSSSSGGTSSGGGAGAIAGAP